jgi:hypothetical protein
MSHAVDGEGVFTMTSWIPLLLAAWIVLDMLVVGAVFAVTYARRAALLRRARNGGPGVPLGGPTHLVH